MTGFLIRWSLVHRGCVACALAVLVVAGILAVRDTPVDALPELGERQVLVYADWTGRSPQEVEDQVTHPLSLALQGMDGATTVRASSMFGFSLVTVIFNDAVESVSARQRVRERLDAFDGQLPSGVQARLGPDATGLGWVFQYYLDVDASKVKPGRTLDLGALRAIQDGMVRNPLTSVPGVAEVGSIGGFVRQYEVEVDSLKMRAAGVTLGMVLMAVEQANLNVGGRTVEENGMELVLRGVGLIRSVEDLEKAVVMDKGGGPVLLRDVAQVGFGGGYRRGALDVDGREVVGGIVVMRSGANARDVIARVKEKIARIAPTLPAGVTIRPFYDRSGLIDRSIGTLTRALTTEVLLVTLAHVVFLFHFRSILVVTLPLPASILGSFVLMRCFGIPSNIMSLSGIAIAIGVLVDAGIVLTENVLRRCGEAERRKGSALGRREILALVESASLQVGRPIGFAMAIILLAFVPVFLLTGQEGRLFHPLAFTKTFAMGVATLLALVLVPVLCTVLVRGPFPDEQRNPLMRRLALLYEPVLDFALARRGTVLAGAALVLCGALALIPRMGSEFMPPLNEGGLLLMPTFVPATAPTEVQRVMAWQDRVIRGFPEVLSAAGKMGRAETATDPAPTEMIETTIQLRPESEWRPGMNRERLVAEMTEALRQVPGSVPGFLQPIEARVLMTSTGLRSQLGIRILGDDLAALQQAALEVRDVVQSVRGASGVTPSLTLGKPHLEVQVDRDALVRHGLRAGDVLGVVESGLGGREAGSTLEGRRRIPIQVRLQRSEREDPERLRDVLVTGTSGRAVPLGQVAWIRRVEGPAEIASENGRLRAFVQANVQGRDLGGFVSEVKARLESGIVPALAARGMTVEYGGEHENQLRAARTLRWVVPAVVLIIFVLLQRLYRSAFEAAHVILAVPFALSGGVFLQYCLGWNFSVAVWVGYIALFGTAIQTGVVMVLYLEEAVERRRRELGTAFALPDLIDAVKDGARLRLRPKVMTVATIVASLLPILWSNGTGSEVMKPIATPVIGGMLSSLVHILVVTPAIYVWLHSKGLPVARPAPSRQGRSRDVPG